MKKHQNISFSQFLKLFPVVELPITLSAESHHTFSKENKPFPQIAIQEFLIPLESEEPDDLTEFIPCFRIPKTGPFHAIVYWKASLMTYEYILVSFNKQGLLIDKKIIAGTKAHGEALAKSVATITEDWEIFMVGGVTDSEDDSNYDPTSSQSLSLELLPTGQIIGTNPTIDN